MSYLPHVSQVPPSDLHQTDSARAALYNVPPPSVLFNVLPPPMPPVHQAGLVSWWGDGHVRPIQAHSQETLNSLQPMGHILTSQLNMSHGDKSNEWLNNWLSCRQRIAPVSHPCSRNLKIFEASKTFKTSIKLTNELQQLCDHLENNFTALSSEEWSEMWREITEKKEEIRICLVKISNPDTIKRLKLALLKRKKKRVGQKNARTYRRKEKIEAADKIQELHKKIDTWLEDMQESVERSKREESLKVEADQVLSEVTHKKAEARRQMSLLSSLLKLRQLRARTWANRGENVSAELGIQFNKVIDSLQKVWEDQLQVYSVEERGLKVMLEGVVEERNQKQDKREREITRQWEQLLFGDTRCLKEHSDIHDFFSAAERDVEDFVLIRSQWDKFLAPPGTPMSTSIPLGWVLPVGPSSQEWAKLLQK